MSHLLLDLKLNIIELFLCTDLKNADWAPFYQLTDPEQAWEFLYNIYLKVLNELAPYVTKKNVPYKDEWINESCLAQIKERDRLRGILRYYKDDDLYEQFNVARNSARQQVNQARSIHIQTGLQEDQLSPKKYWKRLKLLMPGKKDLKDSHSPITVTDNEDGEFSNESDMADYVNNFFIKVGPDLAGKITSDNSNYLDQLSNSHPNEVQLSDFPPITENELMKLCKQINISKSSNIDSIEIKFLKDCMLCSAKQVAFLYNLVFKTKFFPLTWKQATIVPIHKNGIKTNITNYRPISLLPQIVKTLEKLIHTRLLTFIEDNDLMNPDQGGFLLWVNS